MTEQYLLNSVINDLCEAAIKLANQTANETNLTKNTLLAAMSTGFRLAAAAMDNALDGVSYKTISHQIDNTVQQIIECKID